MTIVFAIAMITIHGPVVVIVVTARLLLAIIVVLTPLLCLLAMTLAPVRVLTTVAIVRTRQRRCRKMMDRRRAMARKSTANVNTGKNDDGKTYMNSNQNVNSNDNHCLEAV